MPHGAIGDLKTRIVLAVLAGHVTTDPLMEATGLRSKSMLWDNIRALRSAGLVDFVDGTQGTLHAMVVRVK